jgi:hypothetical protein
VAFASFALRAAALVPNNPIQQCAAQQLTRDRQLLDQFLTSLKASFANHLHE